MALLEKRKKGFLQSQLRRLGYLILKSNDRKHYGKYTGYMIVKIVAGEKYSLDLNGLCDFYNENGIEKELDKQIKSDADDIMEYRRRPHK